LGEFLALAEYFRHEQQNHGNERAGGVAAALDNATERWLTESYCPSRKGKEIDNRGYHLYLAAFWGEELAKQTDDAELAEGFKAFSAKLNENLDAIAQELIDIQGQSTDLGGYYWPNEDKTTEVMRPSSKYNEILESLKK